MNTDTDIELGLGGCGGAYFLASPGELVVEIEKRDRHLRDRRTDLRAILAGPDRRVLQEVTIPDDGRPVGSGVGLAQRARLSAQVDRKGVYALNVTVSNDRYGEEIIWGFWTNCPLYMIETSRGHRDAPHQEPIVLLNPARPGDVCFLPHPEAFRMEVEDLPAGVEALPVYDAKGALVQTLRPKGGRASHTFPAGVHRDAVPWRLHLPAQQAVIQIDGVTRQREGDPSPHHASWAPDLYALWTPRVESYFPLRDYRWLLTPYSRTLYGRHGEEGEVAFRIHNNADRAETIHLSLEFPEGEWPGPVRLSSGRAAVGPKETTTVTVRYTVPGESEGDAQACHLRATPASHPDFTTYSTLTVRTGVAPARRRLSVPVILKPYQHENEQFGYLPDYPVESQVYFDLQNRPFIRTPEGVATWRDGGWATADLRSREGTAFRASSTKIAFDRENDLYLIASSDGQAALLRSGDGGRAFDACAIEGSGRHQSYDIEQFSGHNTPAGPPPLLRYTQTEADPKLIWRRINTLELFLPEKRGGRLTLGAPILISDRCIGLSAHSGIPSTVVSWGDRVHMVWGEATEVAANAPGVPTYAATYDRGTGRLSDPALIGYGPPANDVHNSPSITVDSRGVLHVLVGTHNRPFPYARSLKPNNAGEGWTPAEATGEGLRQTYIGLVCGPDDTLHAAFRLWWDGTELFPAGNYPTLTHQRKRPGEVWGEARPLVAPPFSEYNIFYHRLTIDRKGRLFLSYDHWSTYWFYRADHPGNRRALMTSADGGETWKLAETEDLISR